MDDASVSRIFRSCSSNLADAIDLLAPNLQTLRIGSAWVCRPESDQRRDYGERQNHQRSNDLERANRNARAATFSDLQPTLQSGDLKVFFVDHLTPPCRLALKLARMTAFYA